MKNYNGRVSTIMPVNNSIINMLSNELFYSHYEQQMMKFEREYFDEKCTTT